jgi:manganese/zinc/iron transport system permease protein
MSAMIVAPAAAARQWTDRLGPLVLLAGLFGALSGLVGAVVSSVVSRLPTGPTIILVITAIVALSLLVAPERGLLAARLRAARQRRQVEVDSVLADLFRLAAQHPDPVGAPHAVPALQAMHRGAGVRTSLRRLAERDLVIADPDGRWRLTAEGAERARELVEGKS